MISKEVETIHQRNMFLPLCFSLFYVWWLVFHSHYVKNFKTFQKVFRCPGWMRKNFIPGNCWRVATETWDASCFKKGLLEKRQCSKHLRHIAIKKNILSELNRCISQIPLKYIKLVIPKILFILVLCSFNCHFKITWHPPTKLTPPPPKLKFLTPPSKEFSEIFNSPSPKLEEGACQKLN